MNKCYIVKFNIIVFCLLLTCFSDVQSSHDRTTHVIVSKPVDLEKIQSNSITLQQKKQVRKDSSFLLRFTYSSGFYLKLLANDFQIMNALWQIKKINQPIVTIFGGSRVADDDPYAKQAYTLAKKLANAGMSVMTGAHAGIMKAANCGALSSGQRNASIGVSVKGIKQIPNPCLQKYMALTHFASRKFILINFASAFVIFPGGYGTLDELTEVLNLMGTHKMHTSPVILIGKSFWHKFVSWLQEEVLQANHISKEKLSLITVTDDIDEAFNIIQQQVNQTTIPKAHEYK